MTMMKSPFPISRSTTKIKKAGRFPCRQYGTLNISLNKADSKGDALEQRRMVLVEHGEHPLHYGLAEHRGLVLDLELLAVFVNCSQFPVIQIDDLPVRVPQRGLLLLQIFRIDVCRIFLLALHGG